MEQTQSQPQPQAPNPHGTPILRVLALLLFAILIAVLSSLTTVYFLNRQNQKQQESMPPMAMEETPTTVPSPAPDQTATMQTIDEELFSIQLSISWKKVPSQENSGKQNFRYEDGNGNYFEVDIDPFGRGVVVDQTWEYDINTTKDGIRIAQENKCDNPNSPFCSINNNRMDILIKDSESEPLHNHTYVFFAGNTQKKSGVDLQIFRDILTSFKAK